MYKIAVLGDYNSIYGFAALGLDTISGGGSREEAAETLTVWWPVNMRSFILRKQLAAQLTGRAVKYSEELMLLRSFRFPEFPEIQVQVSKM